ncbi:MAG: DNA alkylation repair protein [Candidatus Margulisbacteria bacterium]|nr:DNA alkylation repair protein [Candidatus Margulisiibacteriota bacterium]
MPQKNVLNINQALILLKTRQQKAQQYFISLIKQNYFDLPQEKRLLKDTFLAEEKLGRKIFTRISSLNLPLLNIIKKLLFSKKRELIILGLFILAEYGRVYPHKAFLFYKAFAMNDDEKVRKSVVLSFRRVLVKKRKESLIYLKKLTLNFNIRTRWFVCAALSPTGENRWILEEPKKILDILKWFMRDSAMPIKEVLGNNLNELAKKQPEIIMEFVERQLKLGNLHTYWIVYRAARDLVKNTKYRSRILKLLKIDAYTYQKKTFR